ncbi:MAG TPA: hypothetical protein VEJ89_00025 [Myxococcaceae bacterium]|nr:hypothetical protein [Myxococcaceae bacterium]
MDAKPSTPEGGDFSLVLGGPLYQLLVRAKLIKPPLNRVGRRMAIISAVAWVPVAILTLVGGRFAGGVGIPFIRDFEVHVRLLGMLPLLILAELVINARVSTIVEEFVDRRIVTSGQLGRYRDILGSAVRLRNSIPAEVILAVLVFGVGHLIWQKSFSLDASTWYATVSPAGTSYTPAGTWYAYVSVPIVQFILLRWYFRLFIWWQYLWRVSRLDLHLVPTHPDRAGGLEFLAAVVFALAPFLVAHSGLVAGYIANRILYQGAKLPEFKLELAGMALWLNLITLGPLFLFGPRLNRARMGGLRLYGRLANDYVQAFEKKWITGPEPEADGLLGSGDIQSLADLANSFQVVQGMRMMPFGKEAVIRLNVIIFLPILPLLLTMIPAEELLERLVKIVL